MIEKRKNSAQAETPPPEPCARARVAGRLELERRLGTAIRAGAISNGWLICGPEGSGKATLAYRMARAILDPAALSADDSLEMAAGQRTFRLVSGRCHPDLFVAERLYDEKTGKLASEISIETVRNLSEFLSKTAAAGGWRVAIVDVADDLNRNAANALLKSLEEPPQKTALLLLAHRPGRLVATLRSRCRRIDLPPLADAELLDLLACEAGLDGAAAQRVVAAAKGRPGRALRLAAGAGADAVRLAEDFLKSAPHSGAAAGFAANFGAKAHAESWPLFTETVLDRLADDARARGRGGAADAAAARRLVEAHAALAQIIGRGEAVNLDRAQMLHAMSRILATLDT
jgi:DNA polymerase-3 subunit delta'